MEQQQRGKKHTHEKQENTKQQGVSYHRWERCVQAGLRPAVLSIAVFVAAAVVDKTHLQVHPTLAPERKNRTKKPQKFLQTVYRKTNEQFLMEKKTALWEEGDYRQTTETSKEISQW